MDRRRFLLTSLAGTVAVPLAAGAQQAGKMYRIGFLQTTPNTVALTHLEVFRQGLRALGYVEGQNIVIEYRMSQEPKDNPGLLADLIGRRIDLLVTWSTPALVAAKQATTTIPIVGISGDPVRVGLVGSLGRPGGNLTGIAILTDELELKNLHLLKEAAPGITRVAILWNPDNPVWTHALRRLHEAAPALGVELQPLAARESSDLAAAFAIATQKRANALLVVNDGIFFVAHRRAIINFAAANRLPAVFGARVFVREGGLMAYMVNFADLIRYTATYVDKILKGAKPADLPVEQPTKFELVINLKTAKALGLTIPPSLLARADEVFE
jgi:putative tryptophan/tyrosine transport system substrate-binding protein